MVPGSAVPELIGCRGVGSCSQTGLDLQLFAWRKGKGDGGRWATNIWTPPWASPCVVTVELTHPRWGLGMRVVVQPSSTQPQEHPPRPPSSRRVFSGSGAKVLFRLVLPGGRKGKEEDKLIVVGSGHRGNPLGCGRGSIPRSSRSPGAS